MATNNDAPYPRAPLAEIRKNDLTGEPEFWITTPWGIYVRDLRADINATPITLTTFTVEDQNASIGTTTITTPTQTGYYTFTYAADIITAAVTSSSLTVAIGWTSDGITKTQTFAAVTGNTTATTGSGTYTFSADASAPITYTTTYASNGAGEMHYTLFGSVAKVGTS